MLAPNQKKKKQSLLVLPKFYLPNTYVLSISFYFISNFGLCRCVCLVVVWTAWTQGAGDPGFDPHLYLSSRTSDLRIGTLVATLQAPGAKGSMLGLVYRVSMYCFSKFDRQHVFLGKYNRLNGSVSVIH